MTDTPYLHIYAQDGNHMEAYIVGNELGLAKLADALDETLDRSDGMAQTSAFAADGEGYTVRIACIEMGQRYKKHARKIYWHRARLPYTGHVWKYERDTRRGAISPHELDWPDEVRR